MRAALLLAAQLGLCAVLPLSAQTTAAPGTAKPTDRVATRQSASGNLIPDKWELSALGGGSFFTGVDNGLGTKLDEGGAAGVRVVQNFWRYFGIEEAYTYSVNNLTFRNTPRPSDPAPAFGNRLHHWDVSGLFYFKPRGSRFRPYTFAGLGAADWVPTSDAQQQARSAALNRFGAYQLTDTLNVMGDFGLGMKYWILPHMGVQVEGREIVTRNPTLGLANFPANGQLYIPRRTSLVGAQVTAGLVFSTGAEGPITCSVRIVSAPTCPGGNAVAEVSCADPAHRLVNHQYTWTAGGGSGTKTVDPNYEDHRGRSRSRIEIPVAKQGPLTLSVRVTDDKLADRFATASATQPMTFSAITVAEVQIVGAAPRCQGEPVTLRTSVTDSCGGGNYRFTWNGVPGTPTTTSPEVRFNAENLGSYNVTASVVDTRDESRTATSGGMTFAVNTAYREPVVACSVEPSRLDFNKHETATLTANATASECSQISSYQWSLNPNEGTLGSPASAKTTYDPSTVRFDSGSQEKVINASMTVTDDRGKMASCVPPAAITVSRNALPEQVADIVFGLGGARVNNCGKRVLWDEVLPKLTQQGYRVALVGHFDAADETPARGKRNKRRAAIAADLDRQRAINSARALVSGPPRQGGGSGVSASSVQVYTAGSTQAAPLKPALCGASNARAAQQEASGSRTTRLDQKRRVEVWLLPPGADVPDSIKSATPVTANLMAASAGAMQAPAAARKAKGKAKRKVKAKAPAPAKKKATRKKK